MPPTRHPTSEQDLTYDSISLRGAGIITIAQPSKGHRFTLDSIVLSDFCRIRPRGKVLEPGAGTGVISICLAKKFPRASFIAVEMQERLAMLCAENIRINGLENRITTVCSDIADLPASFAAGTFDAIVMNPPYLKSKTGRPSPVPERRKSRQDTTAAIEAWLDLHVLLKNRGRLFAVFPAHRMSELFLLMKDRRLEPKRIRILHPHQDRPASLVLIDAVKSGGEGIEVMPPLFVHKAGGGYTDETLEIYDHKGV